jgi:hypothetical protein
VKTAIALILFLGGMAVVLYGLGSALVELIGLYSSALSAPLDGPAGGEQAVSQRMFRFAIIGACGVPPMLVGSVMLSIGFWGRIVRKISKR